MNTLTLFKSAYSLILLFFLLVTIYDLITMEQANLSARVDVAFAYALFIGAITWLTMVERGQASLVGLIPVNKEIHKDSHATLTVVIIVLCVNSST
jgi:hypothetical protein